MTLTIHAGHGLAGANSTTMNISKPTGLEAGDLMLAVIASGRSLANIASPAGWDEVTVSNGSQALSVFTRIADASDAVASTFQFTQSLSGDFKGSLIRISGADQTTPVAASVTANSSLIAPSITTTADNQIVIRACGYLGDDGSPNVTIPGDHTEIQRDAENDKVSYGIAYETVATAGDAGTCAFSSFNSGIPRAISIAIAEAAAPDPGGTLTNLIAYWRMDEASGSRYDSVGSMNLAQAGSVGSDTGKLGTRCATLGTTSVGMHASGASLGALNSETVFFAGWYRLDSVSGASAKPIALLELNNGGASHLQLAIKYDHAINRIIAETVDETTIAAEAISVGTWYHILATWNGSLVNLYVNNNGSSDMTHTDRDGYNEVTQIAFGNSSTGHSFSVDDWGIWDEAPSATDRSDLYNAGSGAIPPGLGSPAGSAANNAAFFGFHGF